LGAEVRNCLSQDLTHYICLHVNEKKIIAAKLLNLFVIKPEWIVDCYEDESKLSETEYEYNDINLEDFFKKNLNLFVNPKTNSSSIPRPLSDPKLVNIPLPTYREFHLPEAPENKLVRRRSERICDLKDSDDSDEDDESSDNEVHSHIRNNKASKYQRTVSKHPERLSASTLEDTMNISAKELLPVVYLDRPAEDDFQHFKANLATDYVLDGNGPGAARRSGFFLKKQPNYDKKRKPAQNNPASSPGKRRGRQPARKQSDESESEENEDSDNDEDDQEESDDDSSENSSNEEEEEDEEEQEEEEEESNNNRNKGRGKGGGGRSVEKSGEKGTGKATAQVKNGQKNAKNVSSNRNNKATPHNAKVIIALTGFDKVNGELATMTNVLQSFIETCRNRSSDKEEVGMKITPKEDISPFHITQYETDVDLLDEKADCESRFTHLIVGKHNKR
jgi:hypothetical protein